MTVHEMLETLRTLLTEPRDQLVDVRSVEPQDGDWLYVTFADGNHLAVTVEEVDR